MQSIIDKIKAYYNTDKKKFFIGIASTLVAVILLVKLIKRKK